MTNAAPDTSETRAEVARMIASRAPARTTRLHAGEHRRRARPVRQAEAHSPASSRFSDTCFLDFDNQPTCDACRPGYIGRRCEK